MNSNLADIALTSVLRQSQAENAKLIDRVRDLESRLLEAHEEKETLLDLRAHSSPVEFEVPTRRGKSSYSTAFAIASDWHCEERIDGSTVNGLNEFNLEIADRRIRKFFDRVLFLTDLQRNGTDIDTLVLGLLGDFVTGQIHEELAETNALPPIQALAWVWDRIRAGLVLLRKKGGFKRIIVPCCHGNHARDTRKQRIKTRAGHSIEWIMYHELAREFSDGFQWIVADGYHVYLPVFGRTFRFHHGDALKYQGGIGGLTIPVVKAIAAWDKSKRADVDVFGHWHTTLTHPKFRSNGSLIGYGDFSLEIKAEFEPPQQQFFLVEQTKGPTISAPIFLT